MGKLNRKELLLNERLTAALLDRLERVCLKCGRHYFPEIGEDNGFCCICIQRKKYGIEYLKE